MENKIIEIQKIDLDAAPQYNPNSYPNSGFYIVFDGVSDFLMMKTKDGLMYGLGPIDEIPFVTSGSNSQHGLSEDFTLNMLSVAIHGNKLK